MARKASTKKTSTKAKTTTVKDELSFEEERNITKAVLNNMGINIDELTTHLFVEVHNTVAKKGKNISFQDIEKMSQAHMERFNEQQKRQQEMQEEQASMNADLTVEK